MGAHRYDLYRFQILPVDRFFQGEMFGKYQTINDVVADKNALFANALKKLEGVPTSRVDMISKVEYTEDPLFLLRVAPNRSIEIESRNFEKNVVENWPSFQILVNNDPTRQLFAIEQRREAFQKTLSVAKSFENSLNEILKSWQLKVYIEPLFVEEQFWNMISQFEGRIKEIHFELITPNMANISSALSDDLKNLAKDTNTDRTKISLTSNPNSTLVIKRTEGQIENLVEYASQGGGNIAVRIQGVKKMRHTKRTTSTIEIDDAYVVGKDAKEVIGAIRGLLR